MRELPLGVHFDASVTTETAYLDSLYQTFQSELVHGNLFWKKPGTSLILRIHPEIEGRHAIFWHIVSGGSDIETERILDPDRCVRIGWIRPILEQFNQDFPAERLVRWWVSPDPRWRGRRYGLATDDYDYVIFVDERADYALLVSAYYVQYPRRRSKFRSEHDQYWEKQEPLA